MAPIFPEVTLEWGGKEYTLTANFALIQRIEQRYSLAAIAHGLNIGEPRTSQVATILSILLKEAGCKDVTELDVYAALMGGVDVKSYTLLVSATMEALVPVVKKDESESEDTEGPLPSGA